MLANVTGRYIKPESYGKAGGLVAKVYKHVIDNFSLMVQWLHMRFIPSWASMEKVTVKHIPQKEHSMKLKSNLARGTDGIEPSLVISKS